MNRLTPEGQQTVAQLAQRHQFSQDAVLNLLYAVNNGNGSMAQFNHPEFGGMGQWMRGGMIMIGDMFNNGLKHRISQLCEELAQLLANQASLLQPAVGVAASDPAVSLFVPPSGNWWPAGLINPTSTGSQNHIRYAYFSSIRRLAVSVNGQVTLYDTLDHNIGGFGQQQSGSSSVTFTSQYGVVDVNSLPIVPFNN